jgi:hypothetical protein
MKDIHQITATEGGEMNRKEAEARAKENDGTYVLWIEVRRDAPVYFVDPTPLIGVGPLINGLQSQTPIIDYLLFTAGTGKVMVKGQAFGNYAPMTAMFMMRSPGPYYAGREVGVKVIKALHFSLQHNSNSPTKNF